MLRGDIVFVDFEPARPAEAAKARPAIVVSNDRANATASRLGRGTVTVVPLTSNVERIHPFQVLLPADRTGLRADSKAQAEQLRSVSISRVGQFVGRVPHGLLDEVDDALRLHLAL